MAKRCYYYYGQQGNLQPFSGYSCLFNLFIETGPAGPNGGTLYFRDQPEEGGVINKSGDCTIARFEIADCSRCANCCTNPPSTEQPYDCINGGCIPKTTYGTPGVYPNLAACQSGCAKNSNCTGECVSSLDLATLQQAADALKSRLCG
jgi:hypothetical protein